MKRFRILIIAPYLSFQETAAPVIQEFPTVDFEMHTGDEFTAISIFNSYPPNAFDAIITRGAIAAILRQFTSVPVVEVDVSLLDILRIFFDYWGCAFRKCCYGKRTSGTPNSVIRGLYPPVRYCSHLLFGVDGKGAGDHSDFSDSY